jgi:hypothetical protein
MARAALAASNPRAAFFSHPFICPAIPQKNLFTPATIIQLYPLKTRNTRLFEHPRLSDGPKNTGFRRRPSFIESASFDRRRVGT